MDHKIQSQINISMPNLINICVDENDHGEVKGRMYHCYSKEPVTFGNIIELLTSAETLFDSICFPQASTKTRCFRSEEPAMRVVKPEKVAMQTEIIQHQGKRGSFVLAVRFRQNSTWQGEIVWLEKGLRRGFANTLDFIKILDSALSVKEV